MSQLDSSTLVAFLNWLKNPPPVTPCPNVQPITFIAHPHVADDLEKEFEDMGIFPKKPKSPTGDPNCKKCKGVGWYGDSYFGTTLCSCKITEVVCLHCNDTGKVSDGYTGKMPCIFCAAGMKESLEKADATPKYVLDNAADMLASKNKPGLQIVPATDKQLQLDYDHEEVPEQFHKVLTILRERFAKGNIKWNKYRSSSGKHWHIVIDLPEAITDQERIIWQAVFGSDYMREGLSLMRLIAKIENPSVLFMMPDRVPEETGELVERPGRKFRDLP